MLNVLIYGNSRANRLKLEKLVHGYTENNSIELETLVSTRCPNKILNLSSTGPGLYFLNLDDLEKTLDGIKFGLNIRNNDLDGSIVFLTEHDVFETGRTDLVSRSLISHVAATSFLASDSLEYENEIKNCIAAYIRKVSTLLQQSDF